MQSPAIREWQPVLLEEHDGKLLQHCQMEPFINSLTQWGLKTHSQDWASSPKGTALDCLRESIFSFDESLLTATKTAKLLN